MQHSYYHHKNNIYLQPWNYQGDIEHMLMLRNISCMVQENIGYKLINQEFIGGKNLHVHEDKVLEKGEYVPSEQARQFFVEGSR